MLRIRHLALVPGLMALPLLGTATITASADSGGAGPTAQAPHIFWTTGGAPGSKPASGTPASSPQPGMVNNLIFHGGAVLHHPHVYLTFWGSQWDGLTQTSSQGVTYTAATIENYETQFFANLGGTAWHGTQSQYCDGIAAGSEDCSTAISASQFVTNETGLLNPATDVWVDDASAAPTEIVTTGLAEGVTQDPVATEATRAAAHFTPNGFNPDGLYFVFTPPQTAATAYGSAYCAYHTEITNTQNPQTPGTSTGIKYSFMPYTPQQGAGCGGNSVNKTDDAFGHGYLDSYTLAGGHEFEEAVTDPNSFQGVQDGWNDASTSENGDKCAYFHAANLSAGGAYWAVQPMWSNEANSGYGGCAMSRGTGPAPFPSAPNGIVDPPSNVAEAPSAALLGLVPLALGALAVTRRRIAQRAA